jgi:release factor glutamine methyltransferase
MSSARTPVQSLTTLPAIGPARLAIGRAMHWHYRHFRAQRFESAVLERVCGCPVLVLPGVSNPRLMRTGTFFASQLHAPLIAPELQVLDMGTGSGVCAVVAACQARRVVAIDINPVAVRCAQINALLNGLEHKIDVLQGDLFAPVAGARFDVVLFNPPFVRGEPRDHTDRAWRSLDVAERFASALVRHLRPRGFALVLVSTYGDAQQFVTELRRAGLELVIEAQRRFINERLTLIKAVQANE